MWKQAPRSTFARTKIILARAIFSLNVVKIPPQSSGGAQNRWLYWGVPDSFHR